MDQEVIKAALQLGLPLDSGIDKIRAAQEAKFEEYYHKTYKAMSRIDDNLGVYFFLPRFIELNDQFVILRQTLPLQTPSEETKAALLSYLQVLDRMDRYTARQFPKLYKRGSFLDSFDNFFAMVRPYVNGQIFHGERLPQNMDELREWFESDGT